VVVGSQKTKRTVKFCKKFKWLNLTLPENDVSTTDEEYSEDETQSSERMNRKTNVNKNHWEDEQLDEHSTFLNEQEKWKVWNTIYWLAFQTLDIIDYEKWKVALYGT